MRNQKIIGTVFNGATFCVSFPKGFDCEPDILITGFEIYGDGDASAYVGMAACANWLLERSEIERSRGAKSDLSEVVGINPNTINGDIPNYDDDSFDSAIKALGGLTKSSMLKVIKDAIGDTHIEDGTTYHYDQLCNKICDAICGQVENKPYPSDYAVDMGSLTHERFKL